MGDETGITKNISASGIYFEMDTEMQAGQTVSLIIDLNVVGRQMKWSCTAEVVREERRDNRRGYGARILSQELHDLDPALG
jgi:environmental stress-induced protein Ves